MEERKKCKFTAEYKNWKKWWDDGNIFKLSVLDASGYFVFYLVVPVIVTIATLLAFPDENASAAFCYVSIGVSSGSSIYDNLLRWNLAERSPKNTKLFLILLANTIVALYSLFEIIVILTTHSTGYRCDYILLAYCIAVAVAANDIWNCISRYLAIANYTTCEN